MLTIFACPKPFTDPHIAMIQRNAIRSWTLLDVKPQIILFGTESGVAELCRELGLEHVPDVARNEFGTPLLNDVFAKAEQRTTGRYLCYVNADIILMSDFSRAVRSLSGFRQRVKMPGGRFMLGGRPWEVPITAPLEFGPEWEADMRRLVNNCGELRSDWACDYFVFPKGMWKNLPPFALGRVRFDNALLFLCRRRGGWLVDATRAVTALHQRHGYPARLGGDMYLKNPEGLRNEELAGGEERLLTWSNATHRYTPDGLRFFLWGFRSGWNPRLLVGKGWYRSFLPGRRAQRAPRSRT
jgi:hypothetical protein